MQPYKQSAKILASHLIVSGWINVHRVELAMPDGATVERHIEDHGPGVAVLPYDSERRVAMLISQPRAAVLRAGTEQLLEAIAGRLEDSDPDNRTRQEALEEAGILIGRIEPVVHLWSMPTISTERLHLYLAPYCLGSRIALGGGSYEEHENISIYEIALAELAADAAAGRLTDAKTLILVQALQLRHPDLFS